MQTILLCGGRGVYDYEAGNRIPKGMVMLGDRPILWHIMKTFATYDHNDFILAIGDGGQYIRNYFLNYGLQLQDVAVSISNGVVEPLNRLPEESWNVKLINTGRNARTGSRIARCRRYVEDETFLIGYSDCLCNVNISNLIAYHRLMGKIITVTGVQPPSRFGTFFTNNDQVVGYSEITNLVGKGGYINGGYMVAESSFFDFLSPYNECTLENEVFSQLAKDGQVAVYPHDGYWQAVDTERDLILLNGLYEANKRPWLPESLSL